MPVDGEIVEGESDIDEAMLTGESVPLHKKSGDAVYMGTIVVNGQLHITVTTPINQTKLAQIIEVVHDAQADKPPIQKMIDVVSSYFVGAILVIAAITFVWWYVST